MPEKKEDLAKKVEAIKTQMANRAKSVGAEAKKDTELRKLRKQLKRTQRRLARLGTMTIEERLKHTQKRLDTVGKLLSDLTKGMKKVQGDPYVHSLRKRTKSLNKRLKKINRTIEKQKKNAPSAPATPPPAAS